MLKASKERMNWRCRNPVILSPSYSMTEKVDTLQKLPEFKLEAYNNN